MNFWRTVRIGVAVALLVKVPIDSSFAGQGQSGPRHLVDPPRGKDVSSKADRTAGPRAQRLPSREELMKQARLCAFVSHWIFSAVGSTWHRIVNPPSLLVSYRAEDLA